MKNFLGTFLFASWIVGAVATGESCDNGKGTCIDVNTQDCYGGTGYLKTGYCAGPSNIICCEKEESCDGGKGTCIDVNTQECYGGAGYLKSGYCPGPSNILCCEESSGLPDRCKGSGPALLPNSYLFTLQNQGFSGHPGALVYVPTNFDKSKSQLDVVVYIHGYQNCISNIVRSVENTCNCSVGQDTRDAYNLIDQFEKASTDPTRVSFNDSDTNLLFVAAEVAYDQSNSSPGRWAEQNMFRNYLNELLTVHMPSIIGSYSLDSINRIRIVSHSGGYYVIGNMAIVGGLPEKVKHLNLFDSLYTNMDQFQAFIDSNLDSFGTGKDDFRFTSLYTSDGGTATNNVNMAKKEKTIVDANQCSSIYYYENSKAKELSPEIISSYSMIYKLSGYSHNDIPRNYFKEFLLAGY
jgi:hypothetical protein